MKLYIALHHHKHGTSATLVAAANAISAEAKAERWFTKHDDRDPKAIEEFVEVMDAELPKGYRPPR